MPVYSIRADVETIYGVDNIKDWADLNNNNDAGEITATITASIVKADDEIDSRLRLGPYVIPFAVVPEGIKQLSALYSGFWLYQSRGVSDFDADGAAQDQLQHHREMFDKTIRSILAGTYLPAPYTAAVKTFPEVVTD